MKRLTTLALAALGAVACRDNREIAGPQRDLGSAGQRPAATALAPATVTDAFAAYLSDNTSQSVLVVGVPSHDTLAVVPIGSYPGISAASPDNQRVYVVKGYVNQLAVIRTSDNTMIANLDLGGSGAAGVVVSPDNQRVYVGSRSGDISVIDATTLQVLAPIPVGIAAFMLDITPDGSHLYVGDDGGNRVAVVNVATRTVEQYVTVGYRPWSVDVTQDGQFVYTANRDGTVSKISTATNSVVATISLSDMAVGLTTTPDNQKVFVANPNNNNVRVISIPTNQVIATVPLTGAYYPQVTPDGRWVYVTRPGQVAVLDAQTHAVVAGISITSPAAGISFVPYTPSSQPTATSITSSVTPTITGQPVPFNATVSSGAMPVTVGSVTFRLGGAACADAPTVLAGPLPLDANGQATASPALLAAGSPYTVRACYSGTTTAPRFDPSEASVAQTVNPAPVGIAAAVAPSSQQYSDQAVLSAQIALEGGALQGETLTGLVTYSVNGSTVGTAAVSAATLPVTVTLTPAPVIGLAAGSYAVAATFTSTNPNFVPGTATGASLAVTAEAAAITTNPAFPTEQRVTAPFRTSGPLVFAFTVREVFPEQNADPGLVAPGNLSLAAARMVLTPSGGGAPITLACAGGSVSGTGYGQVRPFTCATTGLSAAVYQVALQVIAVPGGSYYAGSQTRSLRIYDPSADITGLVAEIRTLVQHDSLRPLPGIRLAAQLAAAMVGIARGNDNFAITRLRAFINLVEALVNNDDLSPGTGGQLILAAEAIIGDLVP